MYYFSSLSKCKSKGMNMRMISAVFVLLMNSKKVITFNLVPMQFSRFVNITCLSINCISVAQLYEQGHSSQAWSLDWDLFFILMLMVIILTWFWYPPFKLGYRGHRLHTEEDQHVSAVGRVWSPPPGCDLHIPGWVHPRSKRYCVPQEYGQGPSPLRNRA